MAFTMGANAISMGSSAQANTDESVTIGTDSNIKGDGIALGKGASAVAGSLALGQGAVATEAMTVSFGAASFERRLTNVSAGVNRTARRSLPAPSASTARKPAARSASASGSGNP